MRRRLVLEGLVIGALTGLVITAYRVGITKTLTIMTSFLAAAREEPTAAAAYIGVMLLLGVLAALCLKFAPLISGSGIPQVSAQLADRLDIRWQKVLPFKFIGGILTLGGGLTLGREGPSVQVGAAVGQAFGDIAKRPDEERKYLISCGGAAGLSAAFNAPVSGLVFALEELYKKFSPEVLSGASAAAFAGAFTASCVAFGTQPVLDAGGLVSLPLRHYWLLFVLGIVTGLSGVLFNRCILTGKALYEKFLPKNKYNWLLRGIVPFFAVALICLAFPKLVGSGEPMIFMTKNANSGLPELLALYAAKLALLAFCFGSGLPGGIFFPLLVLGSLVGGVVGQTAAQLGFMETQYVFELALMAMAGHFASIVRSPLTGVFLVCEMTGAFAHMLPVGIVAMISYGVAEYLRSEPIYVSLQKLLPLKGAKAGSNSRRP